MSPERDSERLLRQWLDEGPTRAADRLLETVEERIDRQRQRPVWRLTWRGIFMNRTVGAFAAGVAVVAIAVIGISLVSGARAPDSLAADPNASEPLASSPSTVTPPAVTSPAATPVASAAPAATTNTSLTWTFSGTLPKGWSQEGTGFAGGEDLYVDVLENRSIMAADCVEGPAPGVGASAIDLAQALAGREGLVVSGLTSDEVGGLHGQQLDLRLADKWTGTCSWWDNNQSPVVPLYGTFDEKNFWLYNAISGGERIRLRLLDSPGDGSVIVAFWAPSAEAFDANIDSAESIVDGIEFDIGS